MNLRQKQDLETRERLSEVARKLFRSMGFAPVTIRMIAKVAKTSTGAIFHKWPNKEALFEDVMGHDWPDPAAFARFVMACPTIEEAKQGAAIFLEDVAGEKMPGRLWSHARRR